MASLKKLQEQDMVVVFMNDNLLKKNKKKKITALKPDGTRKKYKSLSLESAILRTGKLDVGTHVLKAWLEVPVECYMQEIL